MKPNAMNPPRAHRGLLKGLAGLQLLLACGRYLVFGETWLAVSAMIALSLAMILASRERINDERVEQLKLKAISYGFFGGLIAVSLLNTGGKILGFQSFGLQLSPFDGLIIVMLIALALFYYWRWQDGRAGKPG